MALSQVKYAPQKTKDLVLGFVRSNTKQHLIDIPIMISYVVLMYYWIQERFTLHGEDIELDKTKRIARRFRIDKQTYNTVYGNNVIDINDKSIGCYVWTFKVKNIPKNEYDFPICVGLDSSKDEFINQDFSDSRHNHDSFYSIGTNGIRYNSEGFQPRSTGWDVDWDVDVMEMHLNMGSRKLTVWINNVFEVVIANKINFQSSDNKRYNLAIGLSDDPDRNNEIQLIDFSAIQCKEGDTDARDKLLTYSKHFQLTF